MHTFINDDGEMIEQMLLVDGDNHGHNTGKVFVKRHVDNLVSNRHCKKIIENWRRIVENEGDLDYEGFDDDLEQVLMWSKIRSDKTGLLFNVSWEEGSLIAWRIVPESSELSEGTTLTGNKMLKIADNTFAAACLQNSVAELQQALNRPNAGQYDCAEWGITEAEWFESIKSALLFKTQPE